jgi:hypothetical protein
MLRVVFITLSSDEQVYWIAGPARDRQVFRADSDRCSALATGVPCEGRRLSFPKIDAKRRGEEAWVVRG